MSAFGSYLPPGTTFDHIEARFGGYPEDDYDHKCSSCDGPGLEERMKKCEWCGGWAHEDTCVKVVGDLDCCTNVECLRLAREQEAQWLAEESER